MTIQVSMVPASHAFEVWPKVRSHLSRCVEYTHGRFEVEDMLEMIVEGEHDLWIAFDGQNVKGVVTTAFTNYPRKRVLTMQFTGGDDLKEWKEPMLALLRRYASDHHCDAIECSGRVGWAKIFDADGHQLLWNTFELPIGDDDGR